MNYRVLTDCGRDWARSRLVTAFVRPGSAQLGGHCKQESSIPDSVRTFWWCYLQVIPDILVGFSPGAEDEHTDSRLRHQPHWNHHTLSPDTGSMAQPTTCDPY